MKYSEDKIIKMVKITQEIEGIEVSANTERMARELIRGEKTKEELLEEIKLSHERRTAAKDTANVQDDLVKEKE